MDSKTEKEVRELFKSLNQEGQTIIVVSRKTENTGFSTRSIFLRDGRIENGLIKLPPLPLLPSPIHSLLYSDGLLSSVRHTFVTRNITYQFWDPWKSLKFIEHITIFINSTYKSMQMFIAERFGPWLLNRVFRLSKARTFICAARSKESKRVAFGLSFGMSLMLVLYLLVFSS